MYEPGSAPAGIALVFDPIETPGEQAPPGAFKATLRAPDGGYDWAALEGELANPFRWPAPSMHKDVSRSRNRDPGIGLLPE